MVDERDRGADELASQIRRPMFQGIDYFSLLQTAVASLMHAFSAAFWRIGYNVFYASAVIKMIVTGLADRVPAGLG